MIGDYILIGALPIVFVASALLQSVIDVLYTIDNQTTKATLGTFELGSAVSRLTAAIEMLWIAIYCVKMCFLASYKFHQTLSAYVNVYLTRHYWITVGLCSVGFLLTVSQPIVLCPSPGQ